MSSLEQSLAALAPQMTELLSSLVAIPSVSGRERAMTEFVADWARRQGWETDLWESDEEQIARTAPLPPKYIPLSGRPTLVIRLPGTGAGRSLMFNAHADVVAAPNASRWRFGPWSGTLHEGRLYGRGACDAKGPLISALWAMKAIAQSGVRHAGDLLLELVPGEEDCVGLGTLTSVARGWRADGVVVLEPTESAPRCASRGGLRFEITCLGQSVHGTVKWLGRDAIALVPAVLSSLRTLEEKWNDRAADPLFGPYPFMRPVTVDFLHGGDWQGMVCDHCVVGGYLELLPGDDLNEWQEKLRTEVLEELKSPNFSVQILERYAGHRTAPTDPLCQAAQSVTQMQTWLAFNSGCEAGLRAGMLGTATLVWGPGSLAQAHAVDESVELDQVALVARHLAQLSIRFCGPPATTK